MDQEVFKANFFMAIILPIIITTVILGIYAVTDVPPWILALLIVPVVFAVAGHKTKLIVDNDVLRYEKVFGGEEISLKKVSQIVLREVETIVNKNPDHFNNHERPGFTRNVNQVDQERKVEKLYYVLDESGRTIFSFPAGLVGRSNRQRFEESITAINPTIDFS